MIHHAAPARVGILGNPSDGYGGRTLALAVPQFEATVFLEPADGIEIVGSADDEPRWPTVAAMVDRLDRHGYGTGTQLLAAAVRTFVSVAEADGCPVGQGFRLSYSTTIPRQVGLGGSSALVVAALRCLNEYHALDMPLEVLPSVALRVETAQLGLAAGLQDRVVQTYGGLVAMDFTESRLDSRFGISHGTYEQLDPGTLPPVFVAYREAAGQPSDSYHQRLRSRYDTGDSLVRDTMRELATLVTEGRAALRWGDRDRIGHLMDRNMALRRQLGPLPEAQLELVEVAVAAGAHATFAGSGGAVVGTFRTADEFEALCDAYADIGADIEQIPTGTATATTGDDGDADDDVPANNVLNLDRHHH